MQLTPAKFDPWENFHDRLLHQEDPDSVRADRGDMAVSTRPLPGSRLRLNSSVPGVVFRAGMRKATIRSTWRTYPQRATVTPGDLMSPVWLTVPHTLKS